ncbi:MAG: RNA 2',3'-cyclic phosphodiesterase [Spirochaetales bacterium]|nr:RNA 2',3'-cyclic phosphodiesterase [Spirochaetales bacterium]
MRVFIALPVPEHIRESLYGLSESYRNSIGGSWVKKENYHITLLFIGEIEPPALDACTDRLREVLAGQQRFRIVFDGFSAFPSKKNVKVLYSFTGQGDQECRLLHERIAAALPPQYSGGGKFASHLTLARFYKNKPVFPVEAWQQKLTLSFTADKCAVYESVLSNRGAVYSILTDIPFNGDTK